MTDHVTKPLLLFSEQLSRFHYSQIRVKFEGEDGSGPGVNRGFFASLANALKTTDQVSVLVVVQEFSPMGMTLQLHVLIEWVNI